MGSRRRLASFLVGVVAGAGVLVGGWLANRMGMRAPRWRLQIPAIGMVISIPSWAVVFTAADMPAILVALMIGAALLTFHTGPTFALVQSAVAPSMRPVAAPLLLLVVSLIGLGFGPLLIGRLSEMFAARRGADSLRMALLVVPLLYAWAACHYYAGARVLRPDLGRSTALVRNLDSCNGPHARGYDPYRAAEVT